MKQPYSPRRSDHTEVDLAAPDSQREEVTLILSAEEFQVNASHFQIPLGYEDSNSYSAFDDYNQYIISAIDASTPQSDTPEPSGSATAEEDQLSPP